MTTSSCFQSTSPLPSSDALLHYLTIINSPSIPTSKSAKNTNVRSVLLELNQKLLDIHQQEK